MTLLFWYGTESNRSALWLLGATQLLFVYSVEQDQTAENGCGSTMYNKEMFSSKINLEKVKLTLDLTTKF